MREILFRGKGMSGKWYYGNFCRNVYGGYVIQAENSLYDNYIIFEETIGEWTGLYDKNDSRIFEGDIVRIKRMYFNVNKNGDIEHFENNDSEFIVTVRFINGKFCLIEDKNKNKFDFFDFIDDISAESWKICFEREVIGNVHDGLKFNGGNKNATI